MQFQQELSIITKEDGTFNSKARQSFISTNFPEFYDAIISYTSELDFTSTFQERIYHYHHQIPNDVLCTVCKTKKLVFKTLNVGYSLACSSKCSQNHPETIRKREQTMMDTYGVLNPSQSKDIQDTIKKNNLKKYGVTNTAKLQSDKEKKRKTNQQRYGSDTPAGNKDVMLKMISTNQQRYGVDHTIQAESVKKKIVETSLERYGVTNVAKHEEIKKRTRQTQKAKDFENYKNSYPEFNIKNSDSNVLTVECCNGHDYIIPAYIFRQRVKYYKIENPCIICYPINIGSIGEKQLIEYIASLNIEHKINDRAQIGLELDCFIPSKNVAFEYNGVYWHSEKFKDKNYHIDKKKLAHDKGINLVHIWEDDWMERKSIVKSRIRNMLSLISEKLYARKCEIVKVEDYSIYKEFMNDNHIQGFVGSKVVYALVYNDEYVSMMSFGHGRRSTGRNAEEGVYELLRFCNKIDTNVIGGASRLFKHFIKEINPISVFSYASLDWSSLSDNVYEKIGFSYSKTTVPNYWYVKNGIRYHRYGFTKSSLVDKGLGTVNQTEFEIMADNGYERCYDTGSNLYIYLNS